MSRRPAKKRTGPIRKKAPSLDHRVRVALAVLFLAGFLLGSLIFLGEFRRPSEPPERPPVSVDLADLQSDIRVELEGAMLRGGISRSDLRYEIRDGVEWFLLGKTPLPQAQAELLQRRLQRLDPDLGLVAVDAGRVDVRYRGNTWFALVFQPPPPPAPTSSPSSGSLLAIVMDDLGQNLEAARRLLAIDLPVTLAILPNTDHAARTATMAHRDGREVIIHLPSEPQGYPDVNPGRNALLVGQNRAKIQQLLQLYLEQVPYAVGGNNHMGSKFTADEPGMDALLEGMKREGLFFLDSRTSGGTVADRVAARRGVPFLARDVFLDNDAEVEAISGQLRKAINLARRNGTAIAICHPYPETLQALEGMQGELRQAGISVVPVSRLLRR